MLAKVCAEHFSCKDRSHRVDFVHTGVFRCAAVNRLENSVVRTDVAAVSEAEAAYKLAAKVADDIAEKVFSNENFVFFGAFYKPHSDCVNVVEPSGDFRIFSCDLLENFDHKSAGLSENVRFFNKCDFLLSELSCVLECCADDSFSASSRDDSCRNRKIFSGSIHEEFHLRRILCKSRFELVAYRTVFNTGIAAFSILSENRDVDIFLPVEVERVARNSDVRSFVAVKIEFLAESDYRRKICETFVAKLGNKLVLSLFLRF